LPSETETKNKGERDIKGKEDEEREQSGKEKQLGERLNSVVEDGVVGG
jgi:hypothetical protein